MIQDAFGRRSLHGMFHPMSVVVVGASGPGTLGHKALTGLTAAGFERPLVAVDSRERPNAFGVPVYRRLEDIPAPADLAVLVTGAEDTLDSIDRCVAAGVKGAVLLSAIDGLPGRSPEFERQVRARLRQSGIRLMGPGCSALMNPSLSLNVSAGLRMPVGGNVAFIAQSGSLTAAVIDWSHKGIVGFSAFVALGDMVDVGWGNLIDYFGDDNATRAIVICLESVANMRSFLSAARAVAMHKPIIVTKVGRTPAAAQAFPWHQRSQASDDEVFDAALRRVGVIRVHDVEDLFHVADALSKQPCPAGPRLTIVTNAGAPGVLAADHIVAAGTLVPQHDGPPDGPQREASRPDATPLDVLGDGSSHPFLAMAERAVQDSANDALLVVFVPQAMSDPAAAVQGLLSMELAKKPVLLCVPGQTPMPVEQEALLHARLPVFPSVGAAARTFNHLWHYSHNLKALYETPDLYADAADRQLRKRAGVLIASAQQERRDGLSDTECQELLAFYGFDLASDGRVGYELQVGSREDPEFGPVLWLGAGGRLADLIGARVAGLPPLNATLARRMAERSPLFEGLQRLALKNAVSLPAIDAALVRLSQLIVEQPAIREVCINPLLSSAQGAFAGAARIALHGPRDPHEIPGPVFRPFPIQYVSTWITRKGLTVTIRPVRAEDEPLMATFHRRLSENAVYLRYFQLVNLERRTAHDVLVRACFIDYDREMVLIAEDRAGNGAERQILGVASLAKLPRRNHGEVAVLIADEYQRHGLGTELVRRLVDVARDERLDRVVASTMADNHGMCAVFERLGFTLSIDGEEVRVVLDLAD